MPVRSYNQSGKTVTGGNFREGIRQGMITTGLNAAAWHTVASLKGELPRYSGKRIENGRMGGCVYATWKSILQYLGIEKYKDIEIKPQGATLDGVAEEYGFSSEEVAVGEIIQKIGNDNMPIAMEYLPVGSTGSGHAVAIHSVEVKNGRYRFQVMDPDYGKIKPLELKHVQGANYRRTAVVQ